MGLGLATVLSALSAAMDGARAPAAFYARQRSLRALANYAVAPPRGDGAASAEPALVCGVPFRPMTGDALRTPYLLKWIFSKQERLRKPLTPVDGRLVIVPTPPPSRWFVPLSSRAPTVMVNLEQDGVLRAASRRRQHMLLLREVRLSF